jgi:hypothetical protein
MEEQLATAMMARDWKLVAEISTKMAQERACSKGN